MTMYEVLEEIELGTLVRVIDPATNHLHDVVLVPDTCGVPAGAL